jgi:hypothetical protein
MSSAAPSSKEVQYGALEFKNGVYYPNDDESIAPPGPG